MEKRFEFNSSDKIKLTELVVSAQAGDKAAFEILYIEYSRRVYYLALKILCNKEDAEDIMSDVFVTVFEKLGGLKEPKHFTRWLNRITVNKCTDVFKKKRKKLVINENDEALQGVPDSELDFFEETNPLLLPEKALDNSETARMIVDIVDNLPDPQRLCVYYYYYEQLTIAQIAEALDTNENAVKRRLYLAREKLRKELVRLDKQEGIKLYSVAPLLLTPAFKAAFDGFELSAEIMQRAWSSITFSIAESAAAVTASTVTGTAVTSATSATATTATAGTSVTTGLLAALNTKLVTIIASVVVTSGVITGVAVVTNNESVQKEKPEYASYEAADDAIIVPIAPSCADNDKNNNRNNKDKDELIFAPSTTAPHIESVPPTGVITTYESGSVSETALPPCVTTAYEIAAMRFPSKTTPEAKPAPPPQKHIPPVTKTPPVQYTMSPPDTTVGISETVSPETTAYATTYTTATAPDITTAPPITLDLSGMYYIKNAGDESYLDAFSASHNDNPIMLNPNRITEDNLQLWALQKTGEINLYIIQSTHHCVICESLFGIDNVMNILNNSAGLSALPADIVIAQNDDNTVTFRLGDGVNALALDVNGYYAEWKVFDDSLTQKWILESS